MTPTQEYGYVLIPPASHARFLPLRVDDDCWMDIPGLWERTINDPDFGFSKGAFYRRKIDPGEGWEIIPADERTREDCESTDDGFKWISNGLDKFKSAGECAFASRRLAYRRRIQPKSEWLDIKTVKPKVGESVWFYCEDFGVRLERWLGAHTVFTHWRPVKPGEIPEPPKPAVKSREELEAIIRNPNTVWYGPHECDKCGGTVVKSSFHDGGISLNAPHDHHYPNHKWTEHVCDGRKS